jgi:hypothetical protein
VGKLEIHWDLKASREANEIAHHPGHYKVIKDMLSDILQLSHGNVDVWFFGFFFLL